MDGLIVTGAAIEGAAVEAADAPPKENVEDGASDALGWGVNEKPPLAGVDNEKPLEAVDTGAIVAAGAVSVGFTAVVPVSAKVNPADGAELVEPLIGAPIEKPLVGFEPAVPNENPVVVPGAAVPKEKPVDALVVGAGTDGFELVPKENPPVAGVVELAEDNPVFAVGAALEAPNKPPLAGVVVFVPPKEKLPLAG